MGKSDDEIRIALAASMQKWGKRYPDAGYGGMFYHWLREKNPKPYGSFGNGSHQKGIKGAEATASAIFLARNESSKEEIRKYIIVEFGYDLSRTCDEIRPGYHHVETCQQTVPEAITAFMEGTDFEDVMGAVVRAGKDPVCSCRMPAPQYLFRNGG